MGKVPNQVRAFAEFKEASFSDDGKYYLTYTVTYVDITKKKVTVAAVVVNCDLKDGVDLLRSKILDEVRSHGTNLGLELSNNGVLAQDFFRG